MKRALVTGGSGGIGAAVAARRATDALGVPVGDGVEQAHAALVREVGEQPGVV